MHLHFCNFSSQSSGYLGPPISDVRFTIETIFEFPHFPCFLVSKQPEHCGERALIQRGYVECHQHAFDRVVQTSVVIR